MIHNIFYLSEILTSVKKKQRLDVCVSKYESWHIKQIEILSKH